MTMSIAIPKSMPKVSVKQAALAALAVVVALSMALNAYYYAAVTTINSDLVEAGFVTEAGGGGLMGRLGVAPLTDNVLTVAISAAQAAAAVEQLQVLLVEAQAAATAATAGQ